MRPTLVLLLMIFCWPQVQASWLIGVGKSDITGPITDVVTFGYGDSSHVTAGLHDRLWARAFIVEDRKTNAQVTIVVISAGAVFGNVKREVVRRLQQAFDGIYEEGNLLIVADHSHSAPGGQGHHFLHVMATHGFERDSWDAQVEGIVEAVVQARNSLQPGRVLINKGELFNASANRSMAAWLRNPESATMPSIDPEMMVMRFEQGGRPVGMLGWFATHGVSFPMTSYLVSGDNKSYAAWLMEREFGEGFVAAFPQTNAGDMTPNLFLNGTGPGGTPEESARMIGDRQYQKGTELFHSATEELKGVLGWQYEYVNLGQEEVAARWTDMAESVSACESAAAGYAFAAGTVDGRPKPFSWFFKQKYKQGYWPMTSLSSYMTGRTVAMEACHAPKPIALALSGRLDYQFLNHVLSGMLGKGLPPQIVNHEWTPHILPLSIMKIGTLGLLAVPAEFTHIAGFRLKQAVASVEGTGLEELVVAGYANDYSLYVTTPEEYLEQMYEGGATLFGRWTLSAYQQNFARMAAIIAGTEPQPVSMLEPEDLSSYFRNITVPEIPCRGELKHHGILLSPVPDMVWQGQMVKACFTSSNPRLAVRKIDTFLTVERYNHSQQSWQVIAGDDGWDTRLYWHSQLFGATQGFVCIEWDLSADVETGIYRVGHHGLWRENGLPELIAYHGYTQPFAVVQKAPMSVMLVKARQALERLSRKVSSPPESKNEVSL